MRRIPWLTTMVLTTTCLAQTPTSTSAPTTRPSAESTADRLLGSTPSTRAALPAPTAGSADATSGSGAVAPGAAIAPLIREGTHLIERTGRLNHSTDGQTAVFSFDSDGKTMKDAPLVVLPNLKLSTMEAAAQSTNKDVRFRVSGTITEYKGRNYILIEKATVVADIDANF